MNISSETKRKLAVFDVDWTLHPGALGTGFIHQLLLDGVLKADFEIESTYELWRKNPGDVFLSHYRKLFQALVGLPESVLRPIAKKVGEDAGHNLYPKMQRILEEHQANSRFVILISNSPTIVLEAFAATIGADEYSGGDFEFNSHGKLHTMHSTGERLKSGELLRIIQQYDLDLDDSYGYGDTQDDISMLELVTHPVAVSPRPELAAHAKAKGWDVIHVN